MIVYVHTCTCTFMDPGEGSYTNSELFVCLFVGHRRKLGVVAESEEPPNALMTITERTFADRGMAKRIEDSKGAEPVADDEDDKVFGEGVFKAHKFYSFTK